MTEESTLAEEAKKKKRVNEKAGQESIWDWRSVVGKSFGKDAKMAEDRCIVGLLAVRLNLD